MQNYAETIRHFAETHATILTATFVAGKYIFIITNIVYVVSFLKCRNKGKRSKIAAENNHITHHSGRRTSLFHPDRGTICIKSI